MELSQHITPPSRFYSLDVLRGVAAFSVVFWHWQHFFYNTNQQTSFLKLQPYYELFFLFYTKGWLAVDLFFALSGFIFYWLYSEAIYLKNVSVKTFWVLRFSRLYPLHLIALFIVAIAQIFFLQHSGHYFAYKNNDFFHFVLNLLFASAWGAEHGYSFNGPTWSISVEVLLYGLFFALSRLLKPNIPLLLLFSAFGFEIVSDLNEHIGRGMGSFFLGGLVFLVYKAIIASGRVARYVAPAIYLTSALWLLAILVVWNEFVGHNLPLIWRLAKYVDAFCILLLFPLTILTLSLSETVRGTLGKRLSVIGDMSYSSYLLHFPLQMLFIWIATSYVIGPINFYSKSTLITFFMLLLLISFVSHRYYEVPMQKFLRGRMTTSSKANRCD